MPRALVLLLCLPLCACLQPRSTTIDTARTPADFACSVTVLGAGPGREAAPGQEPAWYLVEADRVLRAWAGRRQPRTALPQRVRVIPATSMDQLWRLLADSGIVAAPPAGELLGEEADALAESAGVIVAWSGAGRHRAVLIRPADGDTQAARAWIASLEAAALMRAWAWMGSGK